MTGSRRIHPANPGRTSEPLLWCFEGKELLIVAAGFGVSLACFRFLYGARQWDGLPALLLASIPLTVAVAWLLLLVSGKPKRYATEFLEWLLLRFQCRSNLPTTFLSPSSPKAPHPILISDASQN